MSSRAADAETAIPDFSPAKGLRTERLDRRIETEAENDLELDRVACRLRQFTSTIPANIGFTGEARTWHCTSCIDRAWPSSVSCYSAAWRAARSQRCFVRLPEQVGTPEELESPLNPRDFLPESLVHYLFGGPNRGSKTDIILFATLANQPQSGGNSRGNNRMPPDREPKSTDRKRRYVATSIEKLNGRVAANALHSQVILRGAMALGRIVERLIVRLLDENAPLEGFPVA